ncbi:MAG: hypothetical protein K1000chlam4_00738 [Chlamydiae bacterium]|nr:hypothetical protein [Chlamydiota bacterium]
MPFKVPANFSLVERTNVYDLFGIGKQGEKMWIRRVKAFFTFGWNTAKLTDDYIKNTLLDGSNRTIATQALAANPKWLTRTKDLTVTTTVYAKLRGFGTERGLVAHLDEAVKVDRVFKLIHGRSAEKALETFELKGEGNKAKLQAILAQAVHKGDVDLIRSLAKTHNDLDWKGALDTIATSNLLPAIKMSIVETILSHVDITTLFKDGKALAEWLDNKDTVIRLAFIPHIGDLGDAFVNALDPLALRTYPPNVIPSYILTEDLKAKIAGMKTGKLQSFVKDILGVQYVIKHWDQLKRHGDFAKYLAEPLLEKSKTTDLVQFIGYFERTWLADELAKLPKSE